MMQIKCVLVGDCFVGKSSMLIRHTTNEFNEFTSPGFEGHSLYMMVDGRPFQLNLWNTACQQAYDHLRVLAYPETNVFIICFSVGNPVSFKNVSLKWYPEIRKHCPETPILLVGTQMDLREDQNTINMLIKENTVPITRLQGEALRDEIGAFEYLECSAKANKNLKEVLEEAIQAAMSVYKKKTSAFQCNLS